MVQQLDGLICMLHVEVKGIVESVKSQIHVDTAESNVYVYYIGIGKVSY